MKIQQVVEFLNQRFIPHYQEDYDNAGFLIGDPTQEYSGCIISLDLTPETIEEAINNNLNLIVTHHPFIFGGIKRITTDSQTGRMIHKIISNNLNVYAAHTNLDNLPDGVNGILGNYLGLNNMRILQPKPNMLKKLIVYVPHEQADQVRNALFEEGAGNIGNYDHCSYNLSGTGTFRASEHCNPFVGEIGQLHHEPETRVEVIYESRNERGLIAALKKAHPYEEPAFDLLSITNVHEGIGAGMIGELEFPLPVEIFLNQVKNTLGLPYIRTSEWCKKIIHKVAICGGSGSFLINQAKAQGADIYLTGDLKYHDFQQAENKIIIGDIGHYESEQFAKEIFYCAISKKFPNFACRISSNTPSYIRYI